MTSARRRGQQIRRRRRRRAPDDVRIRVVTSCRCGGVTSCVLVAFEVKRVAYHHFAHVDGGGRQSGAFVNRVVGFFVVFVGGCYVVVVLGADEVVGHLFRRARHENGLLGRRHEVQRGHEGVAEGGGFRVVVVGQLRGAGSVVEDQFAAEKGLSRAAFPPRSSSARSTVARGRGRVAPVPVVSHRRSLAGASQLGGCHILGIGRLQPREAFVAESHSPTADAGVQGHEAEDDGDEDANERHTDEDADDRLASVLAQEVGVEQRGSDRIAVLRLLGLGLVLVVGFVFLRFVRGLDRNLFALLVDLPSNGLHARRTDGCSRNGRCFCRRSSSRGRDNRCGFNLGYGWSLNLMRDYLSLLV